MGAFKSRLTRHGKLRIASLYARAGEDPFYSAARGEELHQ